MIQAALRASLQEPTAASSKESSLPKVDNTKKNQIVQKEKSREVEAKHVDESAKRNQRRRKIIEDSNDELDNMR